MKADRLIELICHPENIQSEDLQELETLVNSYPYFQAARILYLKASNILASAKFRNELKISTVYIPDHKQLYKYLNNLIDFDHSSPEQPEATDPLSNIVTERIKEINGSISVNSLGIPANKVSKPYTERNEPREKIIEIHFPQPEVTKEKTGIKIQRTPETTPSTVNRPDFSNVVSNPIQLDNIPGLVSDYAESTESAPPIPAPVYEVIEHKGSQNYIIEALSSSRDNKAKEKITDQPQNINFPAYIELIEENDEEEEIVDLYIDTPLPEDSDHIETSEKVKERKKTKYELPEMMGGYQLESDFPVEDKEISIGELAGSLRKKEVSDQNAKEKSSDKNALIDKFITEEPTIPKGNLNTVGEGDLSADSNTEKEDLFSETLARIYIKQKLYEKAIATYIKLSLKYPEKSVYFAHRIEKIKDLNNNNE